MGWWKLRETEPATFFEVNSWQANLHETEFIEAAAGAATRFRAAIERTLPHPVSFGIFPRGACGAVCELLGDYLRDSGLGSWNYVMGVMTSGDGGTHAWLELDGTLLDITGDQFDEISERVIVAEAPSLGGLHLGFDRAGAGRPAGLAYWTGATHDEDVSYYQQVRRVADRLGITSGGGSDYGRDLE